MSVWWNNLSDEQKNLFFNMIEIVSNSLENCSNMTSFSLRTEFFSGTFHSLTSHFRQYFDNWAEMNRVTQNPSYQFRNGYFTAFLQTIIFRCREIGYLEMNPENSSTVRHLNTIQQNFTIFYQ